MLLSCHGRRSTRSTLGAPFLGVSFVRFQSVFYDSHERMQVFEFTRIGSGITFQFSQLALEPLADLRFRSGEGSAKFLSDCREFFWPHHRIAPG